MSNQNLRNFLQEYLDSLGQKPNGRRWTIRELVKSTGVSRSTLYTWLDGSSPASPATLRQFAHGLAALKAEIADNDGSANEVFPNLLHGLQLAVGQPDVHRSKEPEFGFVPYAPICDIPPGTTDPDDQSIAGWTFLGAVLGLLQKARGCEPQGERVGVGAFEGLDGDVLAGFFSNPHRAEEWRFLRTPIQVPLNGLILWRDLSAFVRRVLPTLRKSPSDEGAEDAYFAHLQQVLWRPNSRGGDAGSITDDLFPLTVCNEAGRDYVTKILGFGDAQIAMREDDLDSNTKPEVLQQWLMKASDEFQRAVESGNAAPSDLRLPILIVDELTCLRVLSLSADRWRNTEPHLLSSPYEDILSEAPLRPRFSVTIAVRKGRPNAADEFETTRAALEELLWSNTSIVAGYYAGLYHELQRLVALVQEKSKALGERPVAGLYVLRWLSLDLSPSDFDEPVKGTPHRIGVGGRAWSGPAVHDCAAWADIVAGAKALLFADPMVRAQLKRELQNLLGDEAPAAASIGREP